MMESLADFQCPICLELCKDAVESKCCGHAFCSVCAYDFVHTNKVCPFCRQPKFNVVQSRVLRRVISGIKVNCPNIKCQQKISHGDLDKHVNTCEYTQKNCKYCKNKITAKDFYHHMIKDHEEQAKKIIMNSCNDQMKQLSKSMQQLSLSKIKQEPFNPLAAIKNSQNKQAGLGESQKYYCGGLLGYKCFCCDGHCGPTNGENCASCMELDIKMHKLQKGYLVNANGRIAKVVQVNSNKKTYCGIIFKSENNTDVQCNSNIQCSYCKFLTLSLPRYEKFL